MLTGRDRVESKTEKQTRLFNTAETSIPKGTLDWGRQSLHDIWPLEGKVTRCKLRIAVPVTYVTPPELGQAWDEAEMKARPQ